MSCIDMRVWCALLTHAATYLWSWRLKNSTSNNDSHMIVIIQTATTTHASTHFSHRKHDEDKHVVIDDFRHMIVMVKTWQLLLHGYHTVYVMIVIFTTGHVTIAVLPSWSVKLHSLDGNHAVVMFKTAARSIGLRCCHTIMIVNT